MYPMTMEENSSFPLILVKYTPYLTNQFLAQCCVFSTLLAATYDVWDVPVTEEDKVTVTNSSAIPSLTPPQGFIVMPRQTRVHP